MVIRTPSEYVGWLRGLVDGLDPSLNDMFDAAWEVFYIPVIPNDDNRAADGIVLRHRYQVETSVYLYLDDHCRILEFLIALSKRIDELTYDPENPNGHVRIFWCLIDNLKKPMTSYSYDDFVEVFSNITTRNYRKDGSGLGGLFPLRNPSKDQRNIEIWYQVMDWLREQL